MHPAASQALFEEEVKHLTPALMARRGWILNAVAYPAINVSFTAPGRTTLRMTMQCNDWNDLPPSIRLEDPDGVPLQRIPANPSGIFHQGPHQLTNLPFVCMKGAREYHTHPSHVADLWESVRGQSSFTLGGIMTQIWNGWLKGSG